MGRRAKGVLEDRLQNFSWPVQLRNNQLENTKMFSSREAVLHNFKKEISYLEIGILAGDYTSEVINCCNPRSITLVDTFDCDDSIFTEKKPRFNKKGHLDYVVKRFSDYPQLSVLKGRSSDVLPNLKSTFDYIYIDADHSYEAVKSDLEMSIGLLNYGGIIGLNDYIMWDYLLDFQYGVVQAVNEFLSENPKWIVVYFALSQSMFCDIYLQETT
jgi:predicted O-methyltransferase YrrM